mmetsp:Transcript_11616/g.30257  ORF Transcript_11616/g.30257 Transcript_11616/m.30257 type:complete len:89 (+) Transcript_11616:384-650(+)
MATPASEHESLAALERTTPEKNRPRNQLVQLSLARIHKRKSLLRAAAGHACVRRGLHGNLCFAVSWTAFSLVGGWTAPDLQLGGHARP